MDESIRKIERNITIVRVVTAVSFALFSAIQIFGAIYIDTSRVGRLIGLFFYLLITAASFFSLIHLPGVRGMRSVMLVVGLLGLFAMRLLSIPTVFGSLNVGIKPYLLNCTAYLASQLGTLILVFYYLGIRTQEKIKNKQKITNILMTVVIVLYFICLIAECLLRINYRYLIEFNLITTLFTRVLFFLGYAGTALGFMLPSAREFLDTEYINKEQSDADIMLSAPEETHSGKNKNKMRSPVLDDTNIMFSTEDERRPNIEKDKMRTPVYDDSDIMFSTQEESRPKKDKNKNRTAVMDDTDLILSAPESSHSKKNKKKNRTTIMDDTDLILSAPESSHSGKDKDKKRSRSLDDSDLVFSDTENRRSHIKKF